MIGVYTDKGHHNAVSEFFQLFKTPWEFYSDDRRYDVVLSTRGSPPHPGRLTVMYGCDELVGDGGSVEPGCSVAVACSGGSDFTLPLYAGLKCLNVKTNTLLVVAGTDRVAACRQTSGSAVFIHAGFNLFEELDYLLNEGQPDNNAVCPTAEMHIALLKDWILSESIPILEVPPIPAGYSAIACLTHDVDFVGLRRHVLDHTFWGFVWRASVGSFDRFLRKRASIQDVGKNLWTLLCLPLVYLGVVRDPWDVFNAYVELERGCGSTYFLIPKKNVPGKGAQGRAWKKRAANYDATEIEGTIQALHDAGCEVCLHGIDAWCDESAGRRELANIPGHGFRGEIGVRMHWLRFDEQSPAILERAGFTYDSTRGYNSCVGFWAGTTQVYRSPGTRRLLEMPLHVMDTALFYPLHMGLSEKDAEKAIRHLLAEVTRYGGVLTLNWHHRSLAPERLWGRVYRNILRHLSDADMWCAAAGEAVAWLRARRAISFEIVQDCDQRLVYQLRGAPVGEGPDVRIRMYSGKGARSRQGAWFGEDWEYRDESWNGEDDYTVHLERDGNRPQIVAATHSSAREE